MVRVLSTMILTHVSKASVHDCEHVGKALVRKFPFLKEYVSLMLPVFLFIVTYYIHIAIVVSIYVCEMSELQQAS